MSQNSMDKFKENQLKNAEANNEKVEFDKTQINEVLEYVKGLYCHLSDLEVKTTKTNVNTLTSFYAMLEMISDKLSNKPSDNKGNK